MTDKLVTEIATAFEEFKAEHTKQLAELKSGKADVVLDEKVNKINEAISNLEAKQQEMLKDETISQKLADLEQSLYSLNTGKGKGENEEEALQRKTFFDYVREDNRETEHAMKQLTKAVTIGSNAGGGYAVPAPIAQEILQNAIDISPIASIVRTTNTSSPLYERLVDVRGTATGWAGESTTRAVQNSPTLEQVTFTHGELYTNLQTSNWALNDLMFDVENWLMSGAADEFGEELGNAITTGDGTNKPTGFLTGTPVVTADAGRAFGVLQFVATGAAADFAASNPGDTFFDVIGQTNPKYLDNAVWMMNRATKTSVRKFKDGDGNYLWEQSFQAGEPSRILGYPLIENQGMAGVGANAFPVAFGDFREGYELIDLQGMTMIRDEVTVKGHTLFYMASRYGGKVTVSNAIKLVKCST